MDPLTPDPLPFSKRSEILAAAPKLGMDDWTSDGRSEGASEGYTTGASEGYVVGTSEGCVVEGALLIPVTGMVVVIGTYEGKLLGAVVLGCFFLGGATGACGPTCNTRIP